MKKYNLTADEIKNIVSIDRVLAIFGIEYDGKRIPCPIHNGTDKNFSVQGDKWHCFVCDESGDIFSLVQHLNKCDFREAKDFICDRFHLKGEKTTLEYRKKISVLKDEKALDNDFERARELQRLRVCQTLHKLKGIPPAERYLTGLLERFEADKSFCIKSDIHIILTRIINRYGAYRPMIITVNQQKKNPFYFEKEQYKIAQIQRKSLPFGDYSLQGMENEICIISKSLDDFVTMLCDEKPDYWEQAKRFERCALMLECSYFDIGKYNKNGITKDFIVKKVNELYIKYGINISYCGNTAGAEHATYSLLEHYLIDRQETLEKVLYHTRTAK